MLPRGQADRTVGAVWPAEPAAPARTLVDLFDATACRYPRAPALEAGGVVFDYHGLLAAAGRLAAELASHGVGRGDRVGIRVPSGTVGPYVAVLGVLRAGAAYVPVDEDDPAERAEMIWSEAGVCAVVVPNAGAIGGLAIVAGPSPAGGRPPGLPQTENDAWIIFTSGSTGRPKGVAVTHRSAAAFVDAEARLFLREEPLGPGDRVLAGLSLAFDASCEEMWLSWRYGACLVPAPRMLVKSGADFGSWLVEHGITAVSTVPTLLALWPTETLDRVRLLIVGGEVCPAKLVDRLDMPGREFWNTYGPTETTVVACASLMRAGQVVRIGAPLDGWELAVIDSEDRPVAWGETGELAIGGVGVARYLDPRQDTGKFAAAAWHDRPGRVYRSGDLVRADPQGLVFLGRADDQIKLAGRRIELGEIDAALQSLPGVRAAAAAVQDSAAGGQVLVGYLVRQRPDETLDRSPEAFDLAEASTFLRDRLPQALVPVLSLIPELPTRASGKVDRDSLPWPLPDPDGSAHDAVGRPTAYRAPATTSEKIVCGIFAELLGMPRIGLDDNLFEMGGHSLHVTQIVSRIRRELAIELSPSVIFGAPTVAALAGQLKAARPASAPIRRRAAQ